MTETRSRPATTTGARRTTGVLGLAAVVLVFVPGVSLPLPQPSFDGATPAVAAFVAVLSSPVAQVLAAVMSLGTLVWLVFAAALLTTTAQGTWSWQRIAAGGCAVVFAVLGLVAQSTSFLFRSEGVDPQIALRAFDEGNVAFANGWLALGGFGVLLGWDALGSRALPRWSAWWLLLAGAGMAFARFVWLSGYWFFPYAAVWLWIITTCVLLLVGGGRTRSGNATAA